MLVCTGLVMRQERSVSVALCEFLRVFGWALGTTGHSMECHGDFGLRVLVRPRDGGGF